MNGWKSSTASASQEMERHHEARFQKLEDAKDAELANLRGERPWAARRHLEAGAGGAEAHGAAAGAGGAREVARAVGGAGDQSGGPQNEVVGALRRGTATTPGGGGAGRLHSARSTGRACRAQDAARSRSQSPRGESPGKPAQIRKRRGARGAEASALGDARNTSGANSAPRILARPSPRAPRPRAQLPACGAHPRAGRSAGRPPKTEEALTSPARGTARRSAGAAPAAPVRGAMAARCLAGRACGTRRAAGGNALAEGDRAAVKRRARSQSAGSSPSVSIRALIAVPPVEHTRAAPPPPRGACARASARWSRGGRRRVAVDLQRARRVEDVATWPQARAARRAVGAPLARHRAAERARALAVARRAVDALTRLASSALARAVRARQRRSKTRLPAREPRRAAATRPVRSTSATCTAVSTPSDASAAVKSHSPSPAISSSLGRRSGGAAEPFGRSPPPRPSTRACRLDAASPRRPRRPRDGRRRRRRRRRDAALAARPRDALAAAPAALPPSPRTPAGSAGAHRGHLRRRMSVRTPSSPRRTLEQRLEHAGCATRTRPSRATSSTARAAARARAGSASARTVAREEGVASRSSCSSSRPEVRPPSPSPPSRAAHQGIRAHSESGEAAPAPGCRGRSESCARRWPWYQTQGLAPPTVSSTRRRAALVRVCAAHPMSQAQGGRRRRRDELGHLSTRKAASSVRRAWPLGPSRALIVQQRARAVATGRGQEGCRARGHERAEERVGGADRVCAAQVDRKTEIIPRLAAKRLTRCQRGGRSRRARAHSPRLARPRRPPRFTKVRSVRSRTAAANDP